MIRWGRIPGLDGVSRELVALLARCHRKSVADARKIIADAALPKERRLQLRRMTAILRLADGLDYEHRERLEDVVASRAGDTIVLDAIATDGPGPDDAQLRRKADMFEEELGHAVRITVGRAVSVSELRPAETGRLPDVDGAGGGGASGGAARPVRAQKAWR
jgi:exopolyphosphatase/guanosine-5'-triphosphate,3'-diphosphate pyrophosphatase